MFCAVNTASPSQLHEPLGIGLFPQDVHRVPYLSEDTVITINLLDPTQ
jgi:hypothetical protein